MKFRGVMQDHNAMKEFMNIVMSMSKLTKSSVLRLTTDKSYFIVSDDDKGPRSPLLWCTLPNNYYFTQYTMSGVSPEHNEIYLRVSPVMLAKSLSCLKHNAKSLKIKLTNKHSLCLTLEIELASNDGVQDRQLVHDVPIEVIVRKMWGDYEEPTLQDFHVTIEMPDLRYVKNIVERMKNMSHNLIVAANKDGRFTFKIDTNLIKLSTHFPNLSVQSVAGGLLQNAARSDDEDDATQMEVVRCQVDIKKFLLFLTGLQITNHKTICSIVDEKMVRLHFEQQGVVTLQCFLTQVES